MTIPDCCIDCAKPLPLDKPIFRARGGFGARCERCDVLAAAGELEVARLREQAKGIVQEEVRDG